jgi:hypothetical protein
MRMRGAAAAFTVATLLMMLLIGGIEPNPGPGDGNDVANGEKLSQQDSQQNDKQDAILHALERLETKQDQNTARLEKNMQTMQGSLTSQLNNVQQAQNKLQNCVEGLQEQCDTLQRENVSLKKKLGDLEEKCDSLENHSRRNNLLFFGIECGRKPESWDKCEARVREVIKDGMGITEYIEIERAHRTGNDSAIVVKLLSFKQKTLILSKARLLKGSGKFQNVFVREDYSSAVRQKRKRLNEKAQELRSAGQKPKLRFDKLITPEGVYTCDLATQELSFQQRQTSRKEDTEPALSQEEGVDGAGGGGFRHLENDWNFDPFDSSTFPPMYRHRSPSEESFRTDQSSQDFRIPHSYANPNRASNSKAAEGMTSMLGSTRGRGASSNARAARGHHTRQRSLSQSRRSPVQLRHRPVSRPNSSTTNTTTHDSRQPNIATAFKHTNNAQHASSTTNTHQKGLQQVRDGGLGADDSDR